MAFMKAQLIATASKAINRLANTLFNQGYSAGKTTAEMLKDVKATKNILYRARKQFQQKGIGQVGKINEILAGLSTSKFQSPRQIAEDLAYAWGEINRNNLTISHLEAERKNLIDWANERERGSLAQAREVEGTETLSDMLRKLSHAEMWEVFQFLNDIRIGGKHGSSGVGSDDEWNAAVEVVFRKHHAAEGGYQYDSTKSDKENMFALLEYAKEQVAKKVFAPESIPRL